MLCFVKINRENQLSFRLQDSLPEKQVKTFADVKGCPDAKAELEEVVAFLKHPDRFTRHASCIGSEVFMLHPPPS